MEPRKPNILFIFTDQMRGDTLGSLPDSPVISPYLDRLAAEGITFTRCLSNSPLCVPARASLMTGQLVRENGIWSNRSGANEHGPSHVRNIRDAGYSTAVIGKTHIWRHSASGKPGLHIKEMDHNLEAWGFDYRLEINDPIETAWMECHYTDYLASKGLLEAHRKFIKAWVKEAYRVGDPKPWNQIPSPVPAGDDIDSFVGRQAVQWLKGYDSDRPFYLQVQFTGPHDPYDGPQSYRDRYDASLLDPGISELPQPIPPTGGPMARCPSVAQSTTEQRQQWRVGYYANITLIDEWIGQMLSALEQKGELDNTWIIFNSDHGEMLGDHGIWSKANFYEQSIHVPCILRPPTTRPLKNTTGWKSAALIEHVDLPVTMIDIAGAKTLDDSVGQSLLPYVDLDASDARASRGKDAVLSELFGQSTICTNDYKLTVRVDDGSPRQLFDLRNDPKELRNVVGDSRYADTIASLISTHLDPMEHRLDREKLNDYREYVSRTGSVN
ncbi:MAG: sulfatase-like hydrolase/transferase [Desulfobacterales bacterium]